MESTPCHPQTQQKTALQRRRFLFLQRVIAVLLESVLLADLIHPLHEQLRRITVKLQMRQ